MPWCMLFADDIVLIEEIRSAVNVQLEQWRDSLQEMGLRLSRSMTEYMWGNFSGEINESEIEVCIAEDRAPMTNRFKYLGSVIDNNGDITADVTHRIKAEWLKWRAATAVLCDQNIPLKLKDKFYRVIVRSTLLSGSECCQLPKVQECRLDTA
ncbi:uncharacterized protein LOC141712058 [Apium graveolens]|uniref:uncharacterized protein LOC141712058 n=1 Tax=Apium graveolens TaxID=4045 RepID=UPI003D79A053